MTFGVVTFGVVVKKLALGLTSKSIFQTLFFHYYFNFFFQFPPVSNVSEISDI